LGKVRLHHFSHEPDIARFDPRPVRVPSDRPAGREWLNGPLVWAIETDWRGLYLFPRECPRILARATPRTTDADRDRWFGDSHADMIAWVEAGWMAAISEAVLHRYDFDPEGFEDLDDAGMWVSRRTVTPVASVRLDDLPAEHRLASVEVRPVERLSGFADLWSTTLHASGVRLRNAVE
jgi:hypothetical protein